MFVPKGLQRTYDHLRSGERAGELHAPRLQGLRPPGLLAGHERRTRRLAHRPRRAGEAQLVMSTTADDSPAAAGAHAGLQDFFSYPLSSCLQDRRTRRVAQGVSLQAGEITYESANDPSPLTPAGGGDPDRLDRRDRRGHARRPADQADGKPELGTPFLHIAGRAGSSADNAQATAMFMINDEGVWLIQRPQGREAMEAARRAAAALVRTARRPTGWPTPTRSSARSTTSASTSRASGRTTSAGTRSSPTCPAPRASCRSSTTRASTSTCC